MMSCLLLPFLTSSNSAFSNNCSVHGLWRWGRTCLRGQICCLETNIHRARGCRQLPDDSTGQDLQRVLRLHNESVGRIGYKVNHSSIPTQPASRMAYPPNSVKSTQRSFCIPARIWRLTRNRHRRPRRLPGWTSNLLHQSIAWRTERYLSKRSRSQPSMRPKKHQSKKRQGS